MKFRPLILAIALSATTSMAAIAQTNVPIESDSRIKTVVYNENEVYTFVTRHGFQSNIEFGQDENIETISVGDAIGWQVTPAGRRIFIKPLQRNGITNLTVITNKHSYQFELVATESSGKGSNHAYVLRFFYPEFEGQQMAGSYEDRTRGDLRGVNPTPIPAIPAAPIITPPPAPVPALPAADIPVAPQLSEIPPAEQNFNFNYTLTGPSTIAPTKIYDDGRSTFFDLPPSAAGGLEFAIVTPNNSEIPVMARQEGNSMVVDQVAGKMTIRKDGQLICIFNEKILSLPPTASIGAVR